jgi:hypothetical protein
MLFIASLVTGSPPSSLESIDFFIPEDEDAAFLPDARIPAVVCAAFVVVT